VYQLLLQFLRPSLPLSIFAVNHLHRNPFTTVFIYYLCITGTYSLANVEYS
jgi:hypothetical protein